MFIEIRNIKRLQKDGTRTCHAKQWPTPPSADVEAQVHSVEKDIDNEAGTDADTEGDTEEDTEECS